MHPRLAGIRDLIADEGKYHLNCLVKFIRKTSKVQENVKKSGVTMH